MTHAITTRKVAELVPFDRNSRTHNEAQVAQLAASIKEFGFTNPILIDEANVIIAGEGRWTAAKKLNLDEVPCIVLTGLTVAQKAAYVIADNKIALNSGWNADMLHAELARLSELNYDINLTGFNDVEALNLSFELQPMEPEATPPEKDWSGMPEFEQPDNQPHRSIVVHFDNQEDVKKFATILGKRISSKTKWMWFPAPPIKVTATNEYIGVE